MKYGNFAQQGSEYHIHNPATPVPWVNVLINDDYFMEVSQRLCGKSYSVAEYNRSPVLDAEKTFYIKVNGNIYRLGCGEGSDYCCVHEISQTKLMESFPECRVTICVTVPSSGRKELWQIHVENRTDKEQQVQVFAMFPFANILEYQGLTCYYDNDLHMFVKSCFPYYITYGEYDEAVAGIYYSYAKSNKLPKSTEASLRRFYGKDLPGAIPDMVQNGRGTETRCELENAAAAFHHELSIAANNSDNITYLIGVEKEYEDLKNIQVPDYCAEQEIACKKWNQYLDTFYVHTGNEELDYMVNFWVKKQIVYHFRHNRGSSYCNVRNQLQDAAGYSVLDPIEAFSRIQSLLEKQWKNGYLKQWPMTDGSPERAMCRLNHSDAPIWLVLCITEIIENTRDLTLFDKVIPYRDGGQATIAEHLRQAVLYMDSQLGAHGLCLLHDGDWLDPVNGPGRLGKGESVWNTLALIYAIKRFCAVKPDTQLMTIASKLTEAVNTYGWQGDRYIVGYDDDEKPFGVPDDEEGNLFLNTQTWALMAGVCDETRQKSVLAAIERLRTDFGYLLLTPLFSKYNPTWGKISVKHPGCTENGAIYCHGTMFKAFADYIIGDYENAIKTSASILPGNPLNPSDNCLQIPIFLPNYYFGGRGDNFARSSCVNSTGAPAWMMLLFGKYLPNVRIDK